jgi:hypothetical protein
MLVAGMRKFYVPLKFDLGLLNDTLIVVYCDYIEKRNL